MGHKVRNCPWTKQNVNRPATLVGFVPIARPVTTSGIASQGIVIALVPENTQNTRTVVPVGKVCPFEGSQPF
ncbi:hypothetical protein CsSME_00051706 [Camellia sinensis var. sinensis]